MKYVYPSVFTKEEKGYSVFFPDLESCYTCGDNLEDSIMMAEDVLALTLYHYEKENKEIPAPSNRDDIKIGENEFVNYNACDTLDYQKRNSSKAVKKTLSIPEWLDVEATSRGVNFSAILQQALKDHLGL